ncbi:hypothetical protein BaRGS_00022637 [Batillaria attramentaria]|uniref:Uncharacterized protein n=1 Tax=Batillaria attramentaria TaxID=370345 RepID=A0ABD0KGR7_9CAEN
MDSELELFCSDHQSQARGFTKLSSRRTSCVLHNRGRGYLSTRHPLPHPTPRFLCLYFRLLHYITDLITKVEVHAFVTRVATRRSDNRSGEPLKTRPAPPSGGKLGGPVGHKTRKTTQDYRCGLEDPVGILVLLE